MLTPELVRATRRDGKLVLSRFSSADRERAHSLSVELFQIAQDHLGRSREELAAAWLEVPHLPRERRLLEGLSKLVEDHLTFSTEPEVPAENLRREVFSRASRLRRESDREVVREEILREAATSLSLTPEALEQGLYADLRAAHILLGCESENPEALVAAYEIGQIQAVLLRAVRVRIRVKGGGPETYRALFRKLKFRRLLYTLSQEGDGYCIEIDGPFSLFDSVTKYGLQLAMLVPALLDCDSVELEAELRWGKRRDALSFGWEYRRQGASLSVPAALPADVAAILVDFEARPTWQARPAEVVLEVPATGLCVPDIEFTHASSGERVYLEVLGFWSREAVWKRVELAEKGLGARVLFAVSSRLRVSQEVLEEGQSAALYVYKGVMSARAIEQHLERLLAEQAPPRAAKGGAPKRSRRGP